jgi:PAS domain S-box-containing protein
VDGNGSVVFTNWAFADMIGYTPEMVHALQFRQIFEHPRDGRAPIAVIQSHADKMVELVHLDGSSVRARMSRALVLGNGELAVVTFDDLTELLWLRDM